MIYLELFLSFLKIGVFCIGGGYAAMPLIEQEVTVSHSWLTLTEFTDLITIAEMTPGPIGINSASFVGTKIAGVPGALTATAGFILPSLIICTLIAVLYKKFKNMAVFKGVLSSLRPAVIALIAGAGMTILALVAFGTSSHTLSSLHIPELVLFAVAFAVLRTKKVGAIPVMLGCGCIELIYKLITGM